MTNLNLNQTKTKTNSTLLHSNPILSQVAKVKERADESSCATYKGILAKTLYFIAATVVGFVLFFLAAPFLSFGMHFADSQVDFYLPQLMVAGAALLLGIITPIVGIIAKRTIPVTGTIYTLCQGIVIASISLFYKGEYSPLILWAGVITLVIVFAMLLLYTSGKIKVTDKFKAVTFALMLSTIGLSIIGVIACLIPTTRGYVMIFAGNPIFGIVASVIFIIIAALFLISDFQVIRETVEKQLPKKYEWAVSFGLAFTIIWLYFKVLDLLIQLKN